MFRLKEIKPSILIQALRNSLTSSSAKDSEPSKIAYYCKPKRYRLLDNILIKPIEPKFDKVIFVVRPELEVIRTVIYQKKNFKQEKEVYILYVPRRTIECDEELEKAGVRFY